MAIDRVIVVRQAVDTGKVVVLSLDGLRSRPDLVKRHSSLDAAAATFWKVAASIIVLTGVIAAFVWTWWTAVAGIGFAVLVTKANRQTAADVAAHIIVNNDEAFQDWASCGLIWEAPAASLVSG